MPFFRVELERHVSRTVELRQTTLVIVEASDMMSANNAVLNISGDENQLCKYMSGWEDVDSSRQASNDEEERSPSVRDSVRCIPTGGVPVLKTMPSE